MIVQVIITIVENLLGDKILRYCIKSKHKIHNALVINKTYTTQA